MNAASVKEALRLIWLESWKRLSEKPSDPVRKEMEEIAHRAYRNC